ncbi:unnamed protein product [Tetraodon nigroviridis]|uniref:(spotted green pufferfish) hypothetical protein n=1 Tax=Tetraodon nigroviridis TaxID=99883 RepID=Q4SEA3_TETNG|nr:unnamed protein product [Tetraodon nigroviridis]
MLGKIGGAPLALHSLVLCLLVLCFLFSAVSILISLYNSVSNPYETYMGPVGIYVSSSLSGGWWRHVQKKDKKDIEYWVFQGFLCLASAACFSVLVLVIFVLNVKFTNMAEETVRDSTEGIPVELKNKSAEMQLGYYLVIPYVVLSLLTIGIIYMYDHAAYTHRKEQQKPTEDAPKEIMMY